MHPHFGHVHIPDPSETALRWATSGQIDMAGAEMFMAANVEIVGAVLGKIVTPGAAVLEVGAGLGHMGRLVPPQYHGNYWQTDSSSQYVAKAAKRNPGMRSAVADVYNLSDLSFGDTEAPAGFDAVVAMDLLDILDDQAAAAKQIAGVLNEGGVFAHFHNRRPSMTRLSRGLGSFGLVLPALDEDGGLRRFQVVSRKDYDAVRPTLARPKETDILAQRPDLLDYLAKEEDRLFREVVGDLTRRLGSRGNKTDTFVELMHKAAQKALEDAGLTILAAGVSSGSGIGDRSRVADFLRRHGNNPGVNVITKRAGAIYIDTEPQLPKGKVLVNNDLSVIVAEKQAA